MKYHPTQIISLVKSFVLTKLFFSNCRLIRFPIDIRNKRYIIFGKNMTTGRYNRIECYKRGGKIPKLIFHENIEMNDKCHISCIEEIIIEKNVLIASNVFITDHDHFSPNHKTDFQIPWKNQNLSSKRVHIKENVWIGENVSILKGVTIEKNTIIAAGSVVTKDTISGAIYGGVPAKLIRLINDKT
jgi:lipopolysaccharide O-acetyltransferase